MWAAPTISLRAPFLFCSFKGKSFSISGFQRRQHACLEEKVHHAFVFFVVLFFQLLQDPQVTYLNFLAGRLCHHGCLCLQEPEKPICGTLNVGGECKLVIHPSQLFVNKSVILS